MARSSRFLVVGAAVLLSAVEVAIRSSTAAPATDAAPVRTVDVARPQRVEWPAIIDASGGLHAWQIESISSESSGLRIVELLADVGSVVRKGQVLARLSSDGLAADLRSQEANVAQSRGKLAQAEAETEQARRVQDNGTLCEQNVLDSQVTVQMAQAALDAALASLDMQRIALARTRIIAIDDGVVTSRSATLGQVVSAGTELFQLMRQQRLEWRAEVAARQIGQLRAGQLARIRLPDGKAIDAHLRLVAPLLDGNTRTGIAYFDLPAKALQEGAAPGFYVRGEINTGFAMATVLPSTALTLRDGNSYVFEIGSDSRVTQRQVQTGRRVGEQVEVLDSLSADSRVVNGGISLLNDGDMVQVRNVAAPAAAVSLLSRS